MAPSGQEGNWAASLYSRPLARLHACQSNTVSRQPEVAVHLLREVNEAGEENGAPHTPDISKVILKFT